MYARGILFGKMKYELGDHSFVRCPENHLTADVDFKTKGYFGGTWNSIGGVIKNDKTGEVLYELSGLWSGEMVAKNVAVRLVSKRKQADFQALTTLADRSKRGSLRCYPCETYPTNRPTDCRARRA